MMLPGWKGNRRPDLKYVIVIRIYMPVYY